MVQVRCKHCSRLLMKLNFGVGEIKCGRCSKIVKFKVTTAVLDQFLLKLKERDKVIKAS